MRRDRETQLLLLMPPLTGGPTEPRCYGSPARPVMKREVSRVSAQSAYEKLLHEVVDDIFHSEAEVEAEEKDDKVVKVSLKKSAYMSEDVEQKLQLGGADPYGLLELEDKRWRASADEIRRNYRRLVLQHHPDKKVAVATEVAKDDKAEPHATSEEEGEEEDSAFKLLSTAWDLLGSATRRRAFDSVDYFNDVICLRPFAVARVFTELSRDRSRGRPSSRRCRTRRASATTTHHICRWLRFIVSGRIFDHGATSVC